MLGDAHERDARTLQARTYSTALGAMAFLRSHWFSETMRMHGFALDLSKVDSSGLRSAPTSDLGVRITPVAATAGSDDMFWRSLVVLQEAAPEGWPDPDPNPNGSKDAVSVEDLRGMLWPSEAPPLAFFVASDKDRYVGYSVVARRSQSTAEAQFAATAVRPEYRNRGIAKALRARCLSVAKESGYRTVRSASGNPALIHLNLTSGFEETYCEVRLVMRLSS